jgi:hypothetical protein
MRYQRKTLLAAAEAALKASHDQQRIKHTESERKRSTEVKAWNEVYSAAWARAARTIARKLRAGEPILSADLPRELGRSHVTATFLQEPLAPYSPWTPPELGALIQVLHLVSDDEVTTAALRDLGITSSTLRTCADYMAAGTVRA